VRRASLALAISFLAVPLGADTCLGPRNPVPAAVVCGHVMDQVGEPVADVDLQLVSNQNVVAGAHADVRGNFMFGSVPKGEYDLTTKSKGWHLFWPVKVTSSKISKACKQPLEVKLGLKECGPSVGKKGYHAKFGN
jgi:carboxypeptidase family protein